MRQHLASRQNLRLLTFNSLATSRGFPLIISADNHFPANPTGKPLFAYSSVLHVWHVSPGKPDREPAVYLLSKPEIQDNAYYQELSRVLMTVL